MFRKSADKPSATGSGTVPEAAFQNAFWDHWEAGLYVDATCGLPLFASVHKFRSGNGWPCFFETIAGEEVGETTDRSGGMIRIQLRCRTSGTHLGYLFLDGPEPAGLSYCIKSSALRFVPQEDLRAEGYGEFASLFTPKA
ncbi:MAG: peptide-methionine (R)-S-oxide reductase MsrB [Leisingera sp.]